MSFGTRSRLALVLLLLAFGAASVGGCRKNKPPEKGSEPAQDEVASNGDAIKERIEGLRPGITALNAKFAALHKQFDPLPPNLPGFGDVRAKFYGTDEGLGRMGVKIAWLTGRLDAALESGNREELEQVAKDVNQTYDEIKEIDKIALELVHEVAPFERMMKEYQAARAAVASAASTSAPSASAPRAKSASSAPAPKGSSK